MDDFRAACFTALGLLVGLDRDLVAIVRLSLTVSLSAVVLATVLGLPLGAAVAVWRFPGQAVVGILLNAMMGLRSSLWTRPRSPRHVSARKRSPGPQPVVPSPAAEGCRRACVLRTPRRASCYCPCATMLATVTWARHTPVSPSQLKSSPQLSKTGHHRPSREGTIETSPSLMLTGLSRPRYGAPRRQAEAGAAASAPCEGWPPACGQGAGRKWLLDFLYVQQLRRVGTRGREEVLGSEHKYILGWSGIPSHSHTVYCRPAKTH